jgi:hypothetical protein
MGARDKPHYEVSSNDLAVWIEWQGADIWWSVDGDHLLIWRLCFPCPAAKLAAELRAISRPLLVVDHKAGNRVSAGEKIGVELLDTLVIRPADRIELKQAGASWPEYRVLHFSWKGRDEEWLLVEDRATTDRVRRDTAHREGSQPK